MILEFQAEQTYNGYCYKNQEAFDSGVGVCYINEYGFENSDDNGLLHIDEQDLPKLIEKGEFSTRQSIINEVYEVLDSDKEFFVFDNSEQKEMFANIIAAYVFDTVDWQSTQSLLLETDIDEEYNYFIEQQKQQSV